MKQPVTIPEERVENKSILVQGLETGNSPLRSARLKAQAVTMDLALRNARLKRVKTAWRSFLITLAVTPRLI
ncbi:hypothetical protein N9N28_17290 [Rubripirellula amarantea]|nr:hypothetical protein [Rubripirellula amarantea]